jgi:ankyrin repeat protein
MCAALHYAAANGHVECVRLLRAHGMAHVTNDSGNTPLHWAVQNNHTAVVTFLLQVCLVRMITCEALLTHFRPDCY